MKQHIVQRTDSLPNLITGESSAVIDLVGADSLAIQVVVDVNTPAASEFATSDVTAAADTITEVGHGFTTGLKGQASSTTTLPAGLSTSTDYFVIVVDADTYQLASSLSNALAGTQIDITDAGTGTHTFTPTSLAGASVKLEKSNDATNWTDTASATSISADGSVWFEDDAPGFHYARLTYAITAGRMSISTHILAKG